MLKKGDKQFVISIISIAVILIILSFGNPNIIKLEPPNDNCAVGETFFCQKGFTKVDTSTPFTQSYFSDSTCGANGGTEYVSSLSTPYRSGGGYVCKSNELLSNVGYSSFRNVNSCYPGSSSIQNVNIVNEGVCSSYDCNVIFDGQLFYYANNGGSLLPGQDNHILCFNNEFHQITPTNPSWSWFINSNNVEPVCTQLGNWFANSNGLWQTTLPAGCTAPTTGLVASYTFNNSILDDSGNGRTLSLNFVPNYKGGISNSSMNFDGVNNLAIINNLHFENDFSVSLWFESNVSFSHTNDNRLIGDKGTASLNSKGFQVNVNNLYNFLVGNGNDYIQVSGSNPDYSEGNWHHVVASFDKSEGNATIYFDGQLKKSVVKILTGNTSGDYNLSLGGLKAASTIYHPFNGSIDEVKIYDKVLSSSEINSLFTEFNVLPPPNPPGLVSHYTFDNNNVNDIIGNDNGQAFNGVRFSSGKFGNASNFDGVDEYIKINSYQKISGKNYSVSFWMKSNRDYNQFVSSPANNSIFVSWDSQFAASYFTIYQDGKTNSTIYQSSTTNSTEYNYDAFRFNKNEWKHIVGVYDKTHDNITLYVNGVQARAGIGKGNNGIFADGDLYIGGRNGQYAFNGSIDDVRIYDKALTSIEIVELCGSDCVNQNKPLIYMTNSEWNGNFTQSFNGSRAFDVVGNNGLARADYICNHDNNKPGKANAEYKALLGNPDRNSGKLSWVLRNNVSYYRPDGILIGKTKSNSAWFDFNLVNSIVANEEDVITGLNEDGSYSVENCNDYSIGKNTSSTVYGSSDRKGTGSINRGIAGKCDLDYRIYCVEQVEGVIQCIPSWGSCTNWTIQDKQCGTRVCRDINVCDPNNSTRTEIVTCIGSLCGNNVLDSGETCDDNNTISGDGCSSTCQLENDGICGDGTISTSESCDDDNLADDDGCSSTCDIEPKYVCTEEPSICKKKLTIPKIWLIIIGIGIILLILAIIIVIMFKKSKEKNSGVKVKGNDHKPRSEGGDNHHLNMMASGDSHNLSMKPHQGMMLRPSPTKIQQPPRPSPSTPVLKERQ